MAYRVKTDVFDGPFDLLLSLVTRQKVDVAKISLSDLTDQYLAEVEALGDLDLEVASDFMEVAASLLAIKAASLLPRDWSKGRPVLEEDEEDLAEFLTADEARSVLIERLLAYRQFRAAAASLEVRAETESRMHPRVAGPDPEFLGLMPDFLRDMTLRGLAVIAADLAGRRQRFLLEADHVAPPRPPVALTTQSVDRFTQSHGRTTFSELLGESRDPETVVVTLLALLELHKLGNVDVRQRHIFGEIDVTRLPDARPYEADLSFWEEGAS